MNREFSNHDAPPAVGVVADRAVLRAGVVLAAATLLLTAVGCRRKADATPPPSPSASAPAVAPAPPKTAVQKRMESPEYVAALKAIHAERQVKAGEASELQAKLTERAKAFEAENQQATAIRGEIETLRGELQAKEAALAALVKQDPEWETLNGKFQGVQAELEAIGVRAAATVREKMQSHVVQRDAPPGPRVSPPQRPDVRMVPTNAFEVVPVVVTNAPPARPVEPKVSPATMETSPAEPKASPATAEKPGS
jgi:hypothetical protein